MTVGELVFEVSDQASVLIREEIELAKTEVTEKFNSLLRGSVAGLVAGVFALLALALAMHGFAWLLNDLVFDNPWAGFFVEAAVFLLIGAGAGPLRLALLQASGSADARHGDRGGQGDQGCFRGTERTGGRTMSTPSGPDAAHPRQRTLDACRRPARAPPSRSGETSSSSARSSPARSMRCGTAGFR